jgi:membrane protein
VSDAASRAVRVVRRARPGRIAGLLQAEGRLALLAVKQAAIRLYNSNDLTFASSIAYFSLLSLFPFFIFALSLLGGVAATEEQRAEVLNFVLRYFPQQFEFIANQLDTLAQRRFRLGVFGTVFLVWAAMGVFGAITSAVNYAWGVERQHSYFKHKLVSFVMLAAAGLLLLLALVLMSAVQVVEAAWAGALLDRAPWLAGLWGYVVDWSAMALTVLVFGLIYYFGPNARVRLRDVWLGAVLAALLWRAVLVIFPWYLRDVTRWNILHGSLTGVVLFLFWVYMSAVILLFGAELSAAHARLRRHRPEEIPAAPSPRL